MTRLMRVISGGFYLHWPEHMPGENRLRGTGGYVVDLDAPLESEWCGMQMHKLEEAPEGSVPDPITHVPALAALDRWRAAEARRASEALQTTYTESAPVDGVDPLEVKPKQPALVGGKTKR